MKSRCLLFVMALAFCALTLVRADDTASQALDQKLQSIVVSIDFDHATIDQAAAALASLSRQYDPSHKGVQFVVTPNLSATAKDVTLKLNNVPLREVIRYTCLLAGVRYKIGDFAVSINPISQGTELVERTFRVDPNFVQAAIAAGVFPAPPATLPPQ